MSAIAITDHDTVAGVEAGLLAAQGTTLEVIPGIEISSLVACREVHLLGYFVDTQSPQLCAVLARLAEARLHRAKKMVSLLAALGINVSWDMVSALAKGGIVGRPHIAQALVDQGLAASVSAAFDRFLNRDGPAYVERFRLSPSEGLDLIRAAGGLSVLAHPIGVTDFLPSLVDRGLAGLEVFYRGYSPGEMSELLSLTRLLHLVPTGGTDFHGRDEVNSTSLGSVYVPPDTVHKLRLRAGRPVKPA